MLPATARLPDVMRLIAQQSYFVLHAPRQTGKTTAMLSLAQELTASGQGEKSWRAGTPRPRDDACGGGYPCDDAQGRRCAQPKPALSAIPFK